MRRNDPLSLGIEIDEREIRLVQVGAKGAVAHASTHPIPPGAVMGGVIFETSTVIVVLRRALEALGSPVSAAFAVPGEQSAFRTVTVPPCPDSELPALVASEIEHQGTLGASDAYGFFPLFPTDATDTLRSLVVVGVDSAVTRSLVEVAEGSGLAVEVLEPTPLATLRTAMAELPPGTPTFVLIVGSSFTDAAIFSNGRLAALRRIDVGVDSLVRSFPMMAVEASPDDPEGSPALDRIGMPPHEPSVAYDEVGVSLDGEVVDRLALEAQRTVDYVQRASRGEVAIDHVRILGADAQIAPLAAMLERRLGLTVEVPRLPAPPGQMPDVRYSAAYGLAIRESAGGATPAVDLFSAERSAAQRVETKRYFLGSVLVAVLSVGVGLAGCLLYNGQIAASRRRCASIQADTEKARQAAQTAIAARSAEILRDQTLRREGVPAGPLMDVVTSGLDAGVGLKLVTIGDDLSVRLQGEARDETSLVRTAQALRGSPVLLDVAVDKFDRDDKSLDGVIKFELSGGTVSAGRIATEGARG